MSTNVRPRILFVDDEENVLQGLRRLLRQRREQWDMVFAKSGAQGLALMQTQPMDVVVSDMRMPEMDGAEFLSRVRDQHPNSVRIILSGYIEREAILRSIGPSHRYLSKPCTEDALATAIENSLRLRHFLTADHIRAAVGGLSHLPTLPNIYLEILAELSSAFASTDSLAAEVEKDVSISMQLLKLTNSAYFSMPTKAATVRQAIRFLGFDTVRAVVLVAGVVEQFKNLPPRLISVVEVLAARSLSIGLLAQVIARTESLRSDEIDNAFCAGALSHVGTLLLIANYPDRFRSAMDEMERTGCALLEIERTWFGAGHSELGAYLLGLWGFNDQIVEAVAYHHTPSALPAGFSGVLLAVHVAQHLLRVSHVKNRDVLGAREPFDALYLDRGGVANRMELWHDVCQATTAGWPND